MSDHRVNVQSFVIEEGDSTNGGKPGEYLLYCEDSAGDNKLELIAHFNVAVDGKPDRMKNHENAQRVVRAFRYSGQEAATDAVLRGTPGRWS